MKVFTEGSLFAAGVCSLALKSVVVPLSVTPFSESKKKKKNMADLYDEFMKSQPYLPYNMGGRLTEAMIAKAKEELGETEEVKAKTIPELRQLVQAETGLFCPTDDNYLLQYLRARKFDVQRAFSLLKNFYRVKGSNKDLYGSFDEEVRRMSFEQKIGFVLPYRDEEGCAIAVLRMGKWSVDIVNAPEAIITLTLVALMVAQEPANQICGVRLLVDVRGTNLKQIRSLIPRYVILLARAFTNCLPIRFKSFDIYNESPVFQKLITVLKLFLTEKMRNRFRLHGDNQKLLYKSIPKAILPADGFGGDNPNDVGLWFMVEVEKYFDMARKLTTYGYTK